MRGEALDIFHGMKRGIAEELPNERETFMVGDVGSRFLTKRLPVEVLLAAVRDNLYTKGRASIT